VIRDAGLSDFGGMLVSTQMTQMQHTRIFDLLFA